MVLKVLGSSSKGNGYILDSGSEALILECGVNLKEAKKALGFDVKKVAGCCVTHQHNDHAGYLDKYASTYSTPWHCLRCSRQRLSLGAVPFLWR